MIDLRIYKDTVNEAVRSENKKDENWNWSVKAINKSVVKIGWGYLDYIGEKNFFTVTAKPDDDFGVMVIGTLPNGKQTYCWLGTKQWHDCKTFEEGIASVIHGMANTAHKTY